MKPLLLFRNIRFYILIFSFLLSVISAIYINGNYLGPVGIIKITQFYALTAAAYLYTALIIGPFCYNFKTKYNSHIIKARRAIGVSAFYFGWLHALYGFSGSIGGFEAYWSLELKYLIAVNLNLLSLLILTLMAATSFDFMIKFMTFKKWKFLHRSVYIAGIFVFVHALIMGKHFQLSNTNWISGIFAVLILFLLYLEGKRVVANLKSLFSKTPTTEEQ